MPPLFRRGLLVVMPVRLTRARGRLPNIDGKGIWQEILALDATLGLAVPVGLATVGGAPQAVRRTTAASRKRLI